VKENAKQYVLDAVQGALTTLRQHHEPFKRVVQAGLLIIVLGWTAIAAAPICLIGTATVHLVLSVCLPIYILVTLLPLAGLAVNYVVAAIYFGLLASTVVGFSLWVLFPLFIIFNVLHLGVVCPCYAALWLADNAHDYFGEFQESPSFPELAG